SGSPLKARALEVLVLLRKTLAPDVTVISVGGVETADDVRLRVEHGATLVQGYSGFVYEGPLWARKIKKEIN
ncbi:MAG: dihydroorotate dehydrogenase (quinone), partial [Rhodoluna sp.]